MIGRWSRRLPCVVLSLGLAVAGSAPAAELVASAEATRPLAVGQPVPDAALRRVDGSEVRLSQLRGAGSSVVVFYRGGWCPYCNTQLKALREIAPELEERGVRLVALSADRPEKLAATLSQHALEYTLASDAKLEAARAFGIAFRVDDATLDRYRGFGIDLEKASGERHHGLPVPSVFLVDAGGTIRFVHSDPNYKVRLSSEALRAALASLPESRAGASERRRRTNDAPDARRSVGMP